MTSEHLQEHFKSIGGSLVELDSLEQSVDEQKNKISNSVLKALAEGASLACIAAATGQTVARIKHFERRSNPSYLASKQKSHLAASIRNGEATTASQPGVSVAELAALLGLSRAALYNRITASRHEGSLLEIHGWQFVESETGRFRFIQTEDGRSAVEVRHTK
ncbi:hypothetical protein EDF62_1523 [Leucobacter luti]|uniref:Uncharacterized protein n=1 Tax=Leucobacter luti TaxID=340320 RepID=A0A4R6S060_9MICO|nr:hypothetical protein [Leucobacter luti]TDP92317.1 hypothetical protein EDF62_1523 [Leucobacter luti]